MSRIGRDFFTLVAEGHTPAVTNNQLDLTPQFVVDTDTLRGATFIAPATGVPTSVDITIGGTYQIGDFVNVTLESNDSSNQKWTKSYRIDIVQGTTTPAQIAAALNDRIARDGQAVGTPYTSSVAAAVVTVVAKTDDKNALVTTVYTDSAAGTIAEVTTAATISEGQPSDLVDRGVDPSVINLAEYDTVRIQYYPPRAEPHIDHVTPSSEEIFWYGTPGEGNALATLINGL